MRNTKLIFGAGEAGILIGVFLLVLFTGHYSEGFCYAWLTALGAVFAIFTTGNVIASGQVAGSTTTTETVGKTEVVSKPKDVTP